MNHFTRMIRRTGDGRAIVGDDVSIKPMNVTPLDEVKEVSIVIAAEAASAIASLSNQHPISHQPTNPQHLC
jgi:hypothetical protein